MHLETCKNCDKQFDIEQRDNSGYVHGKPICNDCRDWVNLRILEGKP